MYDMKDIKALKLPDLPALSAAELGANFRANRKALGRSQQWLAERVGSRRQTIVELERGGNVGIHTLMACLLALSKGLSIVDARPDLDRVKEIFNED